VTTLVTGTGAPVTVVAHGFGASLAETRPLLRGVPGTRVLLQARGHGDAPAPVAPGYAELADDLVRVADEHRATQALGVSMGAGTVLRLLSQSPDRFAKVVLFLPSALDQPRHPVPGAAALAAALGAGDVDGVRAAVRAEVPDGQEAYVAARTAFLLASPHLPALLAGLAADRPVPDRSVLASVTADVLVLAQEGDPLHPVEVARDLAAALPTGRLVVFAEPGALFRERTRLLDLVAAHLTPERALGQTGERMATERVLRREAEGPKML
jgi:3-oxoadipate enol-lactonase